LLDLPQGLEEGDGHGIGEVEGAAIYGDLDAGIRGAVGEFGGAATFIAKEEVIAGLEGEVLEHGGGAGGEQNAAWCWCCEVGLKISMAGGGDTLGIVHGCPTERFFIEWEAERVDEVEIGLEAGATAHDRADITRDLRGDEHGVEGRSGHGARVGE